MTSPYSPPPVTALNPANSRHRSETYGIRPDLHHQLEENSVSKQDVEKGLKPVSDNMKTLLHRVDLLDEIMDYGVAYMPTDQRFTGAGRLPFSGQRTPLKGVRLEDSGIRLLGKGAWQVAVTVRPSWVRLVTSEIIYRINCYTPSGALHTYQEFADYTTDNTHSVDFGADFVVPGPNYLITVNVHRVGVGRKHLGGWAATRLVAKRWTSSTIAPPSGGASEVEEE